MRRLGAAQQPISTQAGGRQAGLVPREPLHAGIRGAEARLQGERQETVSRWTERGGERRKKQRWSQR